MAGIVEARGATLRDLGLPLATTNYDDLLEEVTKLRPMTWRNRTEVFRVLRGEVPGILHLHGHWRHENWSLPRRRADLCSRCVRVLVEHWHHEVREKQGIAGFDPEAAKAVLAEMAESAGLGRDGVGCIYELCSDPMATRVESNRHL